MEERAEGSDKGPTIEKRARSSRDEDSIERLPEDLMLNIVARVDVESLCSASPVSRGLCSLVSQTLSTITTLDLSAFAPTTQILTNLVSGNNVLRSLTLDCSRLEDTSVEVFAMGQLQELVLLKCLFSSHVFTTIGEKCHHLRLLTLETGFSDELESPCARREAILQMLKGCSYLEALCLKFQKDFFGPADFQAFSFELAFTKTIRKLVLQPITQIQAKLLISLIGVKQNALRDVGMSSLRPMHFGLQSISIVLDLITTELLAVISQKLHHLVELCLEDKPFEEPSQNNDLTSFGLQFLGSCKDLKHLSLTRSKKFSGATFKRVNDIDILHLAEQCKELESVRLGGFSRVTDAGYMSFLHSCMKLKRFEVVDGFKLSDLAFDGIGDAQCSLMEVRLISCKLLTSATAQFLSSCKNLEVLDLSGCKSIADYGLKSIAKVCTLIRLDLSGADITDSGLETLGNGICPLASLCLRGCRRVTDEGIAGLFKGVGKISTTLATLDLGQIPGVSDRALATIAEHGKGISNLSIRYCYCVTDASIAALGSLGVRFQRTGLRMLDIFRCSGLSINSFMLFARPNFRGLRWLGVGYTKLSVRGKNRLAEIVRDRPALTICTAGCEMGCKDGWQFHDRIP